MNRQMNGFTLIELVIVVIVLGVLAVSAIPQFINFKTDAKYAVFNSQFAAFKSAVNLYHSGWLVQGNNGAVEHLANFGDGDVSSTATGYPYSTSGSTTVTFTACEELWTGITDTNLTIGYVEDKDLATSNIDIAYTYSANSCVYRALHFIQAGEKTIVMHYNFVTGAVDIKSEIYHANGSLLP